MHGRIWLPVPESLPIDGHVRTTDVYDESYNSELGLEDHEGLDDVESDNSSDSGTNYDQDSETITTTSRLSMQNQRCTGEYDFQFRKEHHDTWSFAVSLKKIKSILFSLVHVLCAKNMSMPIATHVSRHRPDSSYIFFVQIVRYVFQYILRTSSHPPNRVSDTQGNDVTDQVNHRHTHVFLLSVCRLYRCPTHVRHNWMCRNLIGTEVLCIR
jgi:hypothetical protein